MQWPRVETEYVFAGIENTVDRLDAKLFDLVENCGCSLHLAIAGCDIRWAAKLLRQSSHPAKKHLLESLQRSFHWVSVRADYFRNARSKDQIDSSLCEVLRESNSASSTGLQFSEIRNNPLRALCGIGVCFGHQEKKCGANLGRNSGSIDVTSSVPARPTEHAGLMRRRRDKGGSRPVLPFRK